MQGNSQNDSSNFVDSKSHDREADDLKRAASELNGLWKDLTLLQAHTEQWSKSTFELFLLELRNSVTACKKIFVFQFIFIVLLPMFLFGVAVGAGVVSYYFTLNLLAGYGAFMLMLSFILISLVFCHKYLRQFVGFEYTKEQLKEGLHVSTQKATKRNTDEKA